MTKLYRIPLTLPSLALLWLVAGCGGEAPPQEETAKPRSNVYLEALQEAEATKQITDQRSRDQQRIDRMIGRDE